MKADLNWCEKAVPQLFALNRMLKLRNGNVPVPIIVLTGREDDIIYTVEMETEALYSEGLVENSYPVTDLNDTNTRQLYFLDTAKGIEPGCGNIYFVRDCDMTVRHNRFDVTGAYSPGRFDYKELISLLGFEGLSNELIWNLPYELDLQHKVKEDIADVANRTMLRHFERTGSNEFDPSDFSWIRYDDESLSPDAPETEAVRMIEPERIEQSEPGKKEKILYRGNGPKMQKTSFQQMLKKAGVDPKAVEAFEKSYRISDGNKGVEPKIVRTSENKRMIVKDSLTQEEKESNQKALTSIKTVYEECISYLNTLANSQYTMIRNTMRDALQKQQFTRQFTRMYLDISDDTSTKLYRYLYELDMATADYQKSLVHQAVHLGCVYCNHEWDEDITFLPMGPHLIQCPKCFGDRPFEKEE